MSGKYKETLGGAEVSDNIILNDFSQFEVLFERYINETSVLKHANCAHFYIFNMMNSKIIYEYNYLEDKEVSIDFLKSISEDAKEIEVIDNVSFSLKKNVSASGNENWLLIVDIHNWAMEDPYLIGKAVVCLNEAVRIHDKLNAHYLENLCHRVQTTIMNYEKLYHVIDSYTEIMSAKDKYMPYHMSNVANWCVQLAYELNLDDKSKMILYIAALLHDVGKLFIPDSIINKPGKLTNIEYEMVKLHSIKGYEVSKATFWGMPEFSEIPNIILHHHEHYDGSGYPDGLIGTDIPYLCRIMKVADTVDAMLSRRVYKERDTFPRIIRELAIFSGRQFDPIITDAMIKIIDNEMNKKLVSTAITPDFVAHASLSFFYGRKSTVLAVSGNLIVHEEYGQLFVHDKFEEEIDISKISKATLSYFSQNDFIEFKVKVVEISGETVSISDFIYLPTDKYLSIVWDSPSELYIQNKIKLPCKIVKLGGDTVLVELEAEHSKVMIEKSTQSVSVLLNEKVDEIELSCKIDLRTLKFYHHGDKVIFVFKYLEISPAIRDRIIKILFRKQINLRKEKSKAVQVLRKIRRD